MPVLRVENVSKRFGGLQALEDVSLRAEAGQVTSIIGQNGAGKTTLLNTITQLPPPDSGHIFVGDAELTGTSPSRVIARGVARTFQQLRIFNRLSVIDNVLLGFQHNRGEALWRLVAQPGSVRRQHRHQADAARAILARLNLVEVADTPAGNLSYGLQKLLSLARLMAADAPVLMLDEPTSGLGRDFIQRILTIVSELRIAGKTIILVEHDMDVVFEISDWIVVLNHGKRFAQGRPAEIRTNTEVRDIYFGGRVE